jgi:hypothetical protein
MLAYFTEVQARKTQQPILYFNDDKRRTTLYALFWNKYKWSSLAFIWKAACIY